MRYSIEVVLHRFLNSGNGSTKLLLRCNMSRVISGIVNTQKLLFWVVPLEHVENVQTFRAHEVINFTYVTIQHPHYLCYCRTMVNWPNSGTSIACNTQKWANSNSEDQRIHTLVSHVGTGGAYSGSPGSANRDTNCAIPSTNQQQQQQSSAFRKTGTQSVTDK